MMSVKAIWLDVIREVRLAVAERLMGACLWIMPPGHEREQFVEMMLEYFKDREMELRPIVLPAKSRRILKARITKRYVAKAVPLPEDED